MVLKTEHAMVGIIIALLVGTVSGYIYGQSPIAGYKEEIDRLETINLGISEKKAQLLEEYVALQDKLEDVQESLNQSARAYNDLLQDQVQLTISYNELQEEYTSLSNKLKLLEEENASEQGS